ncbi:Methyl-accepting chemotaxis protein [uncultured Alphaproteobacteria bacterium]|uniref:Methyl-accepting chemotaxis protein n=1 Tax=uncultured Alphaproteobacteria bacterium TaxID=91750 RepID=A0A212K0N1_9PROT|nr:Methyl-accepting chemotaxis protein [uncultured Alphaproteobacteria bacterium]
MRDNGPVTQREVDFPENTRLVSRTDDKGRITFVNAAFAAISGFSEEELTGSAHNIVRHPDMPQEAFADLWATLKSGNPWRGLVKNRTKSGDHYWVRADVMPVIEDGRPAGYVSIRSKPSRAEIAEAERAYRLFRDGKAHGLAIEGGSVVRRVPAWRKWLGSLGGRLAVQTGATLALLALVAAIGLAALHTADSTLQTLHRDRLVPTAQLAEIDRRMRVGLDDLVRIAAALEPGGGDAAAAVRDAEANRDAIAAIRKTVRARAVPGEGADLANAFETSTARYAAEGLASGIKLGQAGDAAGLDRHVAATARPLLRDAETAINRLIDFQQRTAEAEFLHADDLARLSVLAIAALFAIACAVAVAVAWSVRRAVNRPLARMSTHFAAIANRDDDHPIPEEEIAEFRHTSRMLRAMQGLLGYAAQEKIEIDRRSTARAKADLHTLADTLESRVHSVVEEVGQASRHLADSARTLSKNADITRERSHAVQEQAEEVRRNVDSVAAATHELAAAEQEISRQVVNTAEISLNASRQAADTRAAVGKLSESATRIGEIVAVITEVAGRTNMLALNATIEATRAGDAGKGFAVVAGEVKALAHQTGRATEDISRQIRAIQAETETTVAAINRITTTISEVSEVSSAVAAAVEEQGVATREIARSVNEVALGTQAASENVAVVARVASDTETMAMEVLTSADTLRDAAQVLDREVSNFLAGIRR